MPLADKLIHNPQGNYHFLTGIAPYSAGVVAMPGYEIVHVVLHSFVPYRQGFQWIDRYLAFQGRPRQALCAVELRSPEPFTFAGFNAFNQEYQAILEDWSLLVEGKNPVARTNVAPAVQPPAEPSLHAFSYTMPCEESDAGLTFVAAGAGDLNDQAHLSPEAIVCPGDTSPEAMHAKARCVLAVMEARLFGLGCVWSDVTAVGVYTVQPLHTLMESTLLPAIGPAAAHGVNWLYSRPPIAGLEFEMDLRGVRRGIRMTI
jgi:hypothetical protein